MPYLTKKTPIKEPFLDGRVKLLPCMKERMWIMYHNGYNAAELSRIFHISINAVRYTFRPEDRINKVMDAEAKKIRNKRIVKYYKQKDALLKKLKKEFDGFGKKPKWTKQPQERPTVRTPSDPARIPPSRKDHRPIPRAKPNEPFSL